MTTLCKFLLNTDLTSLQNRRASNMGSKHNNAVSVASLNQEVIGIALSVSIHKQYKALKSDLNYTRLNAKCCHTEEASCTLVTKFRPAFWAQGIDNSPCFLIQLAFYTKKKQQQGNQSLVQVQ